MRMAAKISIVLSTYNGEKYIEQQLDSIRTQELEADEVLISDDCSTDNTVKIIKKYIEKYNLDKWEITQNEINKGWKQNFINGIENAKGEYIFTCDQDDIWYPSKVRVMTEKMTENSLIGVLVSDFDEFDERGIIKRKHRETGKIVKLKEEYCFMNVRFPGCVYCIRKEFYNEIKQYWKKDFPHDAFFWRFSMFAGKLYYLDSPTIRQRKHNDSTFTKEAIASKNLKSKLQELEYITETIAQLKYYVLNRNYGNDYRLKILNEAERWNKKRRKFLNTHCFFTWFSLMRYIHVYATPKKYLLDLYLVIKAKRGK